MLICLGYLIICSSTARPKVIIHHIYFNLIPSDHSYSKLGEIELKIRTLAI